MSSTQGVYVGQDISTRLRRPPRPDLDELKAERVQEALTAAQVSARLLAMPGWKLTPGGRAINRTHWFPGVRVASAYVSFIAELAQAVEQTVSVTQRGHRVVVMLRARLAKVRPGGITQSVLDLAQQLG
jgi:pterin-4a-carbinolamine dehydratase